MMGVLVPEEYGGAGFSYDEYVTIISEISEVCGSIGLSVAAHNSLCTGHIFKIWKRRAKKEISSKISFWEVFRRLGVD